MVNEESAQGPDRARVEELVQSKFQQGLVRHEAEVRQKMIEAMRENNADPAYIYAFEKTGLLVFQETKDQFTPEQLEEWADAYEEYSP